MQDHFEDAPLYVPCCQLLQFACKTAPQRRCKVSLAPPDGNYHVGDLEALCRGSVPFPNSGVHIRPDDVVVGSASGLDPQLAGPKTHAWLWSHQEQLMLPNVFHPGREIPAESLKGHKLTDCACQCEFFYLDAAWLNEGRCPGGRPSVSEN